MKFDPFTPKNVKIGTLSWRSMENSSRLNSGTVSHIQLRLGIGIEHQVASRDMTLRSKGKGQGYNNSLLGGPIKFILGDSSPSMNLIELSMN